MSRIDELSEELLAVSAKQQEILSELVLLLNELEGIYEPPKQ